MSTIPVPYRVRNHSRKHRFISGCCGCVVVMILGSFLFIIFPKTLSDSAAFEGSLIEIDTIGYAINVKGEKSWGDYKYKVQETYRFDKKDLPNIRAFLANNQTDNVNVRIWAEKWQARQIEMNGVMVKEYNWWKYAQPAFWLMILPGTIILILLILDRKRLLREPEQEKSAPIR